MGDYLITFESAILAVHYIAVVIVVIAILLQNGKGMSVGTAFGGAGSQSLFGARGAGNFLTKITSIAALVLLLTSLSLSTVANHKARGGAGKSVIGSESAVTDTTAPEANSIDSNSVPVESGAEAAPTEGTSNP